MTDDPTILTARVKLSLARMLQKDIDRGAEFIDNFNCRRADGSVIVSGCSIEVWQRNRAKLLAEAQTAGVKNDK